jgi:hypothetical protein
MTTAELAHQMVRKLKREVPGGFADPRDLVTWYYTVQVGRVVLLRLLELRGQAR